DFSGLLAQVANCINCHNCRVVCPICYCRECLFDSATFRHEPEQYLKWADRKGALKMPTDTLLYHITRMNHMLTSCVSCGLCEGGCPNDVAFLKLFPLLTKEIQPLFEYIPGRSIEDPLPLVTFREEELEAK
ncbi:MAG: 4Fe-4S dicluster domain-containing protein, partial [Candidatus Zixiibacteriota bacterium]